MSHNELSTFAVCKSLLIKRKIKKKAAVGMAGNLKQI